MTFMCIVIPIFTSDNTQQSNILANATQQRQKQCVWDLVKDVNFLLEIPSHTTFVLYFRISQYI